MAKKRTLKRPPVKPPVATLPAVIEKKDTSLSLADPGQVMQFGLTLKKYIEANDLAVTIEGKLYAKVDAWKFAGLNFGLTGIPKRPEQVDKGEMILLLFIHEERTSKDGKKYYKEVAGYAGPASNASAIENFRLTYVGKITKELYRPYFAYKCECDIIKLSDRSIVSYGEGMCSNLEESKILSAEYAINSHCQTRAISRAFRNLLGFVMSSAGIEPTPAEEMDETVNYEARVVTNLNPPLPPDQFQNAMVKVISGVWTVEFVKANSTLSTEQEQALIIAEQNRNPKP